MNKLPIDIVEYIAKSSIPVYHLLINSVPRLINKQGLLKRVVDHFTKKEVNRHGTRYWYLNGKLHREDGPAVIYSDGHKVWYLNGVFHRKDGPAIMGINGYEAWYLNGIRHREDGPAIMYSNGDEEYWLHGIKQKNNKRKRVL